MRDSSVVQERISAAGKHAVTISGVKVYVDPEPLGEHVSIARVRELLEDARSNSYLSVNYKIHWAKYKKLMAPRYVRKVDTLSSVDHTFLEFCTAMRNMAAHRSDESLLKMNYLMKKDDLVGLDEVEGSSLSRSVGIGEDGLGRYLYAEKRNPYGDGWQNTRLGFILARLKQISEQLR